MTNLDPRGRFYLPESLTSYLKLAGPRVGVLGLYSTIELWNPSTFEDFDFEDFDKEAEKEADLIAAELAQLDI